MVHSVDSSMNSFRLDFHFHLETVFTMTTTMFGTNVVLLNAMRLIFRHFKDHGQIGESAKIYSASQIEIESTFDFMTFTRIKQQRRWTTKQVLLIFFFRLSAWNAFLWQICCSCSIVVENESLFDVRTSISHNWVLRIAICRKNQFNVFRNDPKPFALSTLILPLNVAHRNTIYLVS